MTKEIGLIQDYTLEQDDSITDLITTRKHLMRLILQRHPEIVSECLKRPDDIIIIAFTPNGKISSYWEPKSESPGVRMIQGKVKEGSILVDHFDAKIDFEAVYLYKIEDLSL